MKIIIGSSDFVEGCEAIEIPAEGAAAFIKFISQSKFSVAIENDLQSVSEMADGSGALLSSWMSVVDFREMIAEYDRTIADLSEKWQSLGANEIEINGFKKRTKKITIYPSAVKLPDELTLEDLKEINGFEELLSKNITPDREKELIDRCQQFGINVYHVIAPDGFADETLISRDAFKVILQAARGNDSVYGEYFNMPAPEILGMNAEDLKQILPLFKATRSLGIELQIKTCSDEDFKLMTEEEAGRVGEAIRANSSFSIKLSAGG